MRPPKKSKTTPPAESKSTNLERFNTDAAKSALRKYILSPASGITLQAGQKLAPGNCQITGESENNYDFICQLTTHRGFMSPVAGEEIHGTISKEIFKQYLAVAQQEADEEKKKPPQQRPPYHPG